MNNNAEQKPYLRSAENTVSLYEAAEIVFAQLKNNPERWDAIEQFCQDFAWLWTDDIKAAYHVYFANQILEKILGIFPYTLNEPDSREKFYSEFFQAFNIQLEGDANPFLTRLGMLVRKEVVGKKLYTIGFEWNALYKNQMENLPKTYEELDISIAKLGPLSREIEELGSILIAIDTKMDPSKFQR